jgi:uncharacterized protein
MDELKKEDIIKNDSNMDTITSSNPNITNTSTPLKKKDYYLYIYIGIIVIIIITCIFFYGMISNESKNISKNETENNSLIKANTVPLNSSLYTFNGSKFSYSNNRGIPNFTMIFRENFDDLIIYNVSFDSRDLLTYKTKIYGILIMPKNKTNIPGIIFLPAGGGIKENRKEFGLIIAKEGYAVLIIDQRGIGEAGGYYLALDNDYSVFMNGYEPVQHLCVYDTLRSFDVLSNINNIDKSNIAVSGESMGGRYAILSAAMDKRIKGVLGISTSGFHVADDNSNQSKFFLSIDPDNYISQISPNEVVIFQGGNDSVISPADSNYTYNNAKQPKKYYFYPNCTHGYCPDMDKDIKTSLKKIFGK